VIPRFEKAQDRRAPRSAWAAFSGPARIVMLEGWCVGTPPQAASALFDPVNPLEAAEDPDGRWRTQVNASLGGPYRAFFQRLGLLIFLAVPDFAAVLDWRQLQEDKLRARVGPGAPGVMSSAQLRRFVQHYERLTRHALAVMPGRADILLRLDRDQQIMAQAGLA
jgi:D-glycerate 3-kinase